jgi:hypothetical protein
MTKLNRIIVHAGAELVLDMKRMPDGSWKTLHASSGPSKKKKKKKPPTRGAFAALRRKHNKWLNR